MKRFTKLLVNLIAGVLLAVAMLSLTACSQKIDKLTIKLEVFDYEDDKVMQTYTIDADLYADLAPETVKVISSYVNEGYYNNAIFYKIDGEFAYYVGDLFLDEDGNIVQKIKPMISGEFASNNVIGSNLTNKKGSIGLWRSWYESDEGHRSSSDARNSGRSTLYLPTSTIANYDGYMCVFGEYDPEESGNKKAVEALEKAFATEENYTSYTIYYTGEYDENKPNENFGLTFNCIETSVYEETVDEDTVFEPKGEQLECYGAYEIFVPVNEYGEVAAMIKSMAVEK